MTALHEQSRDDTTSGGNTRFRWPTERDFCFASREPKLDYAVYRKKKKQLGARHLVSKRDIHVEGLQVCQHQRTPQSCQPVLSLSGFSCAGFIVDSTWVRELIAVLRSMKSMVARGFSFT